MPRQQGIHTSVIGIEMMRRLSRLLFVFLLYSPGAAAVDIDLTLSRDQIIAGQSTGFEVVVRNDTGEPFRLPLYVLLEVISDRDGVFRANKGALIDAEPFLRPIPPAFLPSSDSPIILAPGEAFLFSIPFHGSSISFFADRRLSWPGSYSMRLGLTNAGSYSMRLGLANEGDEIFWSDVQFLVVEHPTGIDLVVWELMLEQTGDEGWGNGDWIASEVGPKIWEQYRESSYLPEILGPGAMSHADWDDMRHYALQGPFKPYIFLEEARRSEEEWWNELVREGNLCSAQAALAATRKRYERIAEEAEDPHASAVAKKKLRELHTAESLAQLAQEIKAHSQNQ